jgi:shikimate kinase
MIPHRIYLVGMPGSGKSTMANMLANRLAYRAVDLDEMIVGAEGMSIAEVFAQKGETYFREKEKEVLKQTFAMQRIVVATGGGTPCFFDNMALINKNGLAIFLNVPLSLIANRLERQPNTRPLLGDNAAEAMDQLKAIYNKRYSFYDQAEVAVSGLELNAEYVYNKMRAYLEDQ